jgi:WD40 repeat protein
LATGALKPVIDRLFTFDEMVDVHRYLERSGQFGKIVVPLKGHEDEVENAAFGPADQRIVTASLGRTARIWDAASGKAINELKGHSGPVSSASFRPDGTRAVTASRDGPHLGRRDREVDLRAAQR